MDWKSKLTSRKFWTAVASFVAMLVVVFGGDQSQATQITALIMAGATVVAYIVGEGMIDAASAGATVNITGNPTITGVSDTPTAGQAAEVKADTALPSAATEAESTAGSKVAAPATPAAQAITQAESGAVASGSTGEA